MLNILKLSIVALMAAFISLSAQPKLFIENNSVHDWGNVKPEQGVLKGDIKLHNKGDKTLEIKRVKPGCGCTTDSLDTDIIAPGKFATLRVNLNISGYQGNTVKSVRISSNDPEKPEQNLLLKCNVVVHVGTAPKYLGFNRLIVDEESSTRSVITNNTDKPIKIINFSLRMASKDIDPTELKHNIRRNTIIEPKASYTVEMKYKPKKTGRLQSTLTIQTDSKESPTIELPIWGNIIEPQTGKN
ncbi:MAG: DUF1573 domain-containing protein [Candidatus Kapabacteria bacterium]|nr:DUF1573 domain-containing protein [Ignavibacteriota bacterium]MCW5885941.1 DUF1573 domain-containing protein [Candidatus Kapabacteria bacterium]